MAIDGPGLAVGHPFADVGGAVNAGHVHVFERQADGSWFEAASFGLRNAAGSATATATLPPGGLPALAGLTARHAAVVLDPVSLAISSATNPTALQLVP